MICTTLRSVKIQGNSTSPRNQASPTSKYNNLNNTCSVTLILTVDDSGYYPKIQMTGVEGKIFSILDSSL